MDLKFNSERAAENGFAMGSPPRESSKLSSSTPKKRGPALMPAYIPPHRRTKNSTNNVVLDINLRRSTYDIRKPIESLENDISIIKSVGSTDDPIHPYETNQIHSNDIINCNLRRPKSENNQFSKPVEFLENHIPSNTSARSTDTHVHPDKMNQTCSNDINYNLRRPKSEINQFSKSLDNNNLINQVNTRLAKLSDDEIIKRILDLVNVHVNLGFKAIAKEIYREKYGEPLPSDLLETMKFCITLDSNSLTNRNSFSLTFNDEQDSSQYNSISDQNENSSTVFNEPAILNLEEYVNNEYWINIYNCVSISEMWGAIIDSEHLGKLGDLAEQMMLFYESKNPATSVEQGLYYAVFDGSWHRVKCVQCDSSHAVVLFIDRGDQESYPLAKLHELDRRFFILPAQAVKTCIPDLNIFSNLNDALEILNELVSETIVFAEITNLDKKKNCLLVQLYFKKDEETVNIKDLITNKLFKTILDPKSYIELNKMMQVQISHKNENGIFIQLPSKSLQYFKLLMKELDKNYLHDENFKRQTVVRFDNNKTYLVKNTLNEKWYRAKILQFKNDKEIKVSLIDVGSTIHVNREDFILLEKLSSILVKYPEQAILVQLDQFPSILDSKVLNHLHNLTCDSNDFYVKFITSNSRNKNTFAVQLLKKTKNNFFASINDALLLSQKAFDIKNDINLENKSEPKDDLETSESDENVFLSALKNGLKLSETCKAKSLPENGHKTLKLNSVLNPPTVPEGSYFDAHVAVVNDPSHFVIQLLRSKSLEFMKMTCDLSELCNCYNGPKFTYESIQIGQLYACKSDANNPQWFRAYTIQLKDTNTVTVFLCDYGSYRDINIINVVPLQTQFYELPYQAIYAELYGIKPVSEQWTVKDCLRFKDLTRSKNFVCLVKSKKDIRNKYNDNLPVTVETLYRLELIDTSTDQDIFIRDILINEKRALATKKN